METGMNRILVVDDEPDINMLLMLILEDSGYKVDVYDDPILALSNFKSSLLRLSDIRYHNANNEWFCILS